MQLPSVMDDWGLFLCHNIYVSHGLFTHRCLELAERGHGKTGINPMVGAVLVRDGEIIAEGWHSAFGADHAERDLFNPSTTLRVTNQESAVTVEEDDILYVNLEPCCHKGKTPPCTDLIIEKGIKNVVFGMFDPNPIVAGQGIEVLRSAGVKVIGPIERARCEWFNRGFVSLMLNKRPWITLKRAQTKDGRIANKDLPAGVLTKVGGSPLKITSSEQDAWSHEWLRAKHDAILVGVETIVRDDPQLTVRMPADRSTKCEGSNKKIDQFNPLRIVLDPNFRIPENAKIISGDLAHGTIIITNQSDSEKKQMLEERGVRIWGCSLEDDHFDFHMLWELLTTPVNSFHGITSILVEGGQKTWEQFQRAKAVDAEVVLGVGAT